MAKWHLMAWALDAVARPASITQSTYRVMPPEVIALLLRMMLLVAPKLSDLLVAAQPCEQWHHLVRTAMA